MMVVPIRPELLGDDRVDEVVVRLRQEEQFLHPLHQPAAEHAAGADGNHRLHHLVSAAERIRPRVQEDISRRIRYGDSAIRR